MPNLAEEVAEYLSITRDFYEKKVYKNSESYVKVVFLLEKHVFSPSSTTIAGSLPI